MPNDAHINCLSAPIAVRIRLGRRLVSVTISQRVGQPLVVSFGMGTDAELTCVPGARINHALSVVAARWFTVPQIAQALHLHHRAAAAVVVAGVAEGTWSSEYLDDHGFRVPVFRLVTGTLSDLVAA